MPEMRLLPWIPAIQQTEPMCQVLASDLNDSGDRTAQDPYAPDTVVSGVLPSVSR